MYTIKLFSLAEFNQSDDAKAFFESKFCYFIYDNLINSKVENDGDIEICEIEKDEMIGFLDHLDNFRDELDWIFAVPLDEWLEDDDPEVLQEIWMRIAHKDWDLYSYPYMEMAYCYRLLMMRWYIQNIYAAFDKVVMVVEKQGCSQIFKGVALMRRHHNRRSNKRVIGSKIVVPQIGCRRNLEALTSCTFAGIQI